MRHRFAVLPLLGLALAAPPLAAQEAPAGNRDIVVTGQEQQVDRTEVTRQARAITRQTDVRHSPLARFEDFACPGVAGLAQEYAEPIVARLRFIAEDLDIPLADETKCTPNILVVFTEDGREDLAAIEKRTHWVSEVVSLSETRELIEEPGPVRVWSITETRMQNGTIVPRRRDLVSPPVGRMEGGQSLIKTAIRQDIVAVMVLYDREAVKGKTLRQLADYAAMRVFARTRNAEGEAAADSILGLFDRGNPSPPLALTGFDQAYLAALYEGSAHLRGLGKLMRVGRHLEQQQDAAE